MTENSALLSYYNAVFKTGMMGYKSVYMTYVVVSLIPAVAELNRRKKQTKGVQFGRHGLDSFKLGNFPV
jgi:hypothetical protein